MNETLIRGCAQRTDPKHPLDTRLKLVRWCCVSWPDAERKRFCENIQVTVDACTGQERPTLKLGSKVTNDAHGGNKSLEEVATRSVLSFKASDG